MHTPVTEPTGRQPSPQLGTSAPGGTLLSSNGGAVVLLAAGATGGGTGGGAGGRVGDTLLVGRGSAESALGSLTSIRASPTAAKALMAAISTEESIEGG
eukprot:jgi/Ulvmu1/5451/UM225_0002.1